LLDAERIWRIFTTRASDVRVHVEFQTVSTDNPAVKACSCCVKTASPDPAAVLLAGYAHCNINTTSIYWLQDEQMWVLSDLVCASPLGRVLDCEALCINVRNAPPEVMAAAMAGTSSLVTATTLDAWQLGLLAYELLTGKPLFHRDTPVQFVTSMLIDQSPLPWELSPVRFPSCQCMLYWAEDPVCCVLGKSRGVGCLKLQD
jgi:hypothetical protein